MTSQRPELPQPQKPDEPPRTAEQAQHTVESLELKSARTLATVASIAGPASLIIGGVALSTVAVICATIAIVKVKHVLSRADPSQRTYALSLRRTALLGVVIGLVALVLNAVSVAMILPTLIEAMQTGDYRAILGNAAAQLPSAPQPSSGGNAWG